MDRPRLTRRGLLAVAATVGLAGCEGTGNGTATGTDTLEIPAETTRTVTAAATVTDRPDDGGGSTASEADAPTSSEIVISEGETYTTTDAASYSAIVWDLAGELVIDSGAGFVLASNAQ